MTQEAVVGCGPSIEARRARAKRGGRERESRNGKRSPRTTKRTDGKRLPSRGTGTKNTKKRNMLW